MSAVHVSFLIDEHTTFRSRAHATNRGEPLGSVYVDDCESGLRTIQATDPEALRRFAAALVESAERIDQMLADRLVAS